MIPATPYKDRTVAVFGLARSGRSAVASLAAGGARVLAWDDDASHRDVAGAAVTDLYDTDFADLDALLVAPGVPLTHPQPHPLVAKAHAADVPVIGDTEVFARLRDGLPEHALVAITGTNGKSTTTALIGHVLAACGRPTAVGGNIGVPVLDLDPLPAGGVYVFEMSSFQIDLTHSLNADVAILLNITPDHLDRHGDMASYVAAKRRLFECQSGDRVAIIGVDDEPGRAIAGRLDQRVVPVSVDRPVDGGVWVLDGRLFDGTDGPATTPVGDLGALRTLRGPHSWQNVAATYATGRVLGLSADDILAAVATFPGLRHRQQLVAERDGVAFVNDSKGTNPDAAARALDAFEAVHWIAGGRAKGDDFSALVPHLAHVRRAYLIGEAAGLIAEAIAGHCQIERAGTLDAAVAAAAAAAAPGDTVLLSPACTAFDQFADFEARGDAFVRLVGRLDGDGA